MVLVNVLGVMTYKSRHLPIPTRDFTANEIFQEFGVRTGLISSICMFLTRVSRIPVLISAKGYIYLVLSGLCIITQVVFLCWFRETTALAVVVSLVGVLALVPFYWVIQ